MSTHRHPKPHTVLEISRRHPMLFAKMSLKRDLAKAS